MEDAASELRKVVNIGPVLARELAAAGFTGVDDLRAAGHIEAVRRLRQVNPDRDCMNSALAIAGAIRGIRWMQLPRDERAHIAAEVRSAFS